MQAELCVRLGVSLPFLQKSKAPHNKVDEVARGQIHCEIKSLYLLPLQDDTQKTPSTDHCSCSTLWLQMCVTQTLAFRNARTQDATTTQTEFTADEGHKTTVSWSVGLHGREGQGVLCEEIYIWIMSPQLLDIIFHFFEELNNCFAIFVETAS